MSTPPYGYPPNPGYPPQPGQQPQYAPAPGYPQPPQYAPQPGYPGAPAPGYPASAPGYPMQPSYPGAGMYPPQPGQPMQGIPGMDGRPLFDQPFDARSVDPASGFDSVPSGEYKVLIYKHEVKRTNDQTGFYLQWFMRILEGPYQNRELQWKLNLWNSSEQAVKISYSHLSALGHVTGVFSINNPVEFYNKPFIAMVTVEGTWSNVKGVKYLNGERPGKAGQGVAAGAPPATMPGQPQLPMQVAGPTPGAPPQYGPPGQPAAMPMQSAPPAPGYPAQPGQPYQVAPMPGQPQPPPQQTMWPAGPPQNAQGQPALPAAAPWGPGAQSQQPGQPPMQYAPAPGAPGGPAPAPTWRG